MSLSVKMYVVSFNLQGFDHSHLSVGVTFIPKQLGVELTMSRADVTSAEDADINSH